MLTWLPISESSAGEFIAPAGRFTSGGDAVAAARAAAITRGGSAPVSRRSAMSGPAPSISQTRHTPVNTLSWIRTLRSPSMRIDTSPSPSISFTIASTGGDVPRRSSTGPAACASKRHASSAARYAASRSRASRSATGSARSGTSGIRNVFMSRGIVEVLQFVVLDRLRARADHPDGKRKVFHRGPQG